MRFLVAGSMTLPDGSTMTAPAGIPTGGLSMLSSIMQNAISIMVTLAVIICLIVVVYSGFQWASSGGDKNKIAKARSRLSYAVIGLLVVFLSFFIVTILGTFFNIKLF